MLRNIFQAKFLPYIQLVTEESKNLVAHFKSTDLVQHLTITLHQEYATRWNSRLDMFEFFYPNYEDLAYITLKYKE